MIYRMGRPRTVQVAAARLRRRWLYETGSPFSPEVRELIAREDYSLAAIRRCFAGWRPA